MLNVINNVSDDRWTSVEGPQDVGRPKVKTQGAIHTKTFLHSLRTDMAFTASIISRSVICPGLLGMCESMSNCRGSTYHR